MLEVIVCDEHGYNGAFRFENDALQAYLTGLAGIGCQLVSLQALGTPLVVTGEMPKPPVKQSAKAETAADKAEAALRAQANQDRRPAVPEKKAPPLAPSGGKKGGKVRAG